MSNKIPESAWGDVIARRANNESVSSIVQRYNCSPATVYGVLKKATGAAPPAAESRSDVDLRAPEQQSEPKLSKDPEVSPQSAQAVDADDPPSAPPQQFPEREQKRAR